MGVVCAGGQGERGFRRSKLLTGDPCIQGDKTLDRVSAKQNTKIPSYGSIPAFLGWLESSCKFQLSYRKKARGSPGRHVNSPRKTAPKFWQFFA